MCCLRCYIWVWVCYLSHRGVMVVRWGSGVNSWWIQTVNSELSSREQSRSYRESQATWGECRNRSREHLFTSVSTFLTQLINLCTWVKQHISRSLSLSPSFSQLIMITKGTHKHIRVELMNKCNNMVTGQLSHLNGSESISADTSSQIHPVALSSNLIMDPFKLH